MGSKWRWSRLRETFCLPIAVHLINLITQSWHGMNIQMSQMRKRFFFRPVFFSNRSETFTLWFRSLSLALFLWLFWEETVQQEVWLDVTETHRKQNWAYFFTNWFISTESKWLSLFAAPLFLRLKPIDPDLIGERVSRSWFTQSGIPTYFS